MPKIIAFIGYCPYNAAGDLIDRVETVRQVLGLTQKKMAKILHVDESSLAGWVRREHKPEKRSQEILRHFLLIIVASCLKNKLPLFRQP